MKEVDPVGGILVVLLIVFMIGFVQGDIVEGWVEAFVIWLGGQ